MVLSIPADAVAAMEQGHSPEWVVTAFYGAEQTIPSAKYVDGHGAPLDRVPVTSDGRVTFDADGQTQANGSLYLADTEGPSLVPEAKTDPLAPYGQEVAIARRVKYADQSWDIPLGRYRIEDVPDAKTLYKSWPSVNAPKQFGYVARLDITDMFDKVIADDFLAVTGPTSTSTWTEIQSLSPLPIIKSLPDQPIPAGLVYRSRADAIKQLIGNLGGEPHLTRLGYLTARPKSNWLTATTPVAVVNGAVSVSGGMSNNLKNYVAVTNPQDEAILGQASITDPADPLRVSGPMGRRTQELSDPLMDTQVKADAAALTALRRLSSQQSRVVKVTCLPRPDLELGDYIQVNEFGQDTVRTLTGPVLAVWLGEVRRMEFSMNPLELMTMELTVSEKR